MQYRKNVRTRALSASGLAMLVIAGCSTTGGNIESAAALDRAKTSATDSLVFGQLQLVRNGHDVALGDGLRDNPATLHLYRPGDEREIIRDVGSNGEFAWVLPAGTYRVMNVGFRHHGETLTPLTNFSFEASNARAATYVGALTVEVSVDSGYLGLVGTLDSHSVQADCATSCKNTIARLGLNADDIEMSTLRWEGQVAGRN